MDASPFDATGVFDTVAGFETAGFLAVFAFVVARFTLAGRVVLTARTADFLVFALVDLFVVAIIPKLYHARLIL